MKEQEVIINNALLQMHDHLIILRGEIINRLQDLRRDLGVATQEVLTAKRHLAEAEGRVQKRTARLNTSEEEMKDNDKELAELDTLMTARGVSLENLDEEEK